MRAVLSGWKYALPSILCLLFFCNGLNDAVQNSAVADEVGGHMASGYLYWTTGEYSGGIANFPLPHLLIALPVVLLGRSFELFTEQQLVLFRLPVLLMGVLSGAVVYRFTAGLFDRKAALAALLLFSMSPNFLAHSSVATLDVPIAFFVLLTLFTLWRYVQQPRWTRMLALSLALAGAMTTKLQAVMLVPVIVVILAAWLVWPGSSPKRGKILNWSCVLLLIVPYVFINLVYLHVPLHAGHVLPPLFETALQKKLMHATGVVGRQQVAYLCGRYSADGWWYYFPFAILVKTPLPTLILLAIGAARRHSRQVLLFVILPIVAFLGVAMTSSVNIGLRHVLIVYPFLFMLAGRGAAGLYRRSWRGVVLGLLGAVYLGQALMIAPHHTSYFNLACGGPANGHQFLIGSNYDSGQDDHFLRRYVEQRGLTYQINPDAFTPTTGHILVKANALYGAYGNGGPKAYAWLKRFEPVNRIAYTWFEYDVPADAHANGQGGFSEARAHGPKNAFRPWNQDLDPDRLDAALGRLTLYLRSLRREHAQVEDPRFAYALAKAFVSTAAYEDALDELRAAIRQAPGSGAALGLGGEIMVRWKVGILRFEGDQYLTGFGGPDPGADQECPEAAAAVRLAATAGISTQISRAHYSLAAVLDSLGRPVEAREQYSTASQFAPPPPGRPSHR